MKTYLFNALANHYRNVMKSDNRGQGMTEYIIIVVLLAVLLIVVVQSYGKEIYSLFDGAKDDLSQINETNYGK